jgi:hypothetical protein
MLPWTLTKAAAALTEIACLPEAGHEDRSLRNWESRECGKVTSTPEPLRRGLLTLFVS